MQGQDRLTLLCEQDPATVTGIDFVQVVDPEVQTLLRVFFLIDPDELQPQIIAPADLPADIPVDTVSIISISGGESLAEVPVVRATYSEVPFDGEQRTVLEVETARPGDFSIYRLTVHHDQIDRFFNAVEFSFKQGCPSDLDCKQTRECPPETLVDFPVDYMARDFGSLRNALLDFAAQRYPNWSERIEADVGVMLAEVMAALGDELSYIQDRYAREAYLETASQRRSLRWHTRLVDYNIHDGLSATTLLDVNVSAGQMGTFIDAGSRFWARRAGEPPIPFEVGEGLVDQSLVDQEEVRQFWVHEAWNAMTVYVPDEGQPCLEQGATELFVRDRFPLSDQRPDPDDAAPAEEFWIGRQMVLKSNPEDPSLPQRRHLIEIVEVERTEDPLVLETSEPPNQTEVPIAVTRIRWTDEQALPFGICLTDTVVCGNIVPAVAGQTFTELFVIGENEELADNGEVATAVERQGPCNELTGERSPIFLYSLTETEDRGLGWVGELRTALPEVELLEVNPTTLAPINSWKWEYQRSLLNDSNGQSPPFTLDDGIWRRVIGFQRIGEVIEHHDYAGRDGFSVRFGDGEFGPIPPHGSVFQVRYRTGPGTGANLAADTVTQLDDPPLLGIASVTNPFPITSGVDPETPDEIKQLAPEAFKALPLRAVRDEDYIEIVERLPWVQRAGATARWTGSWLSEFATADPLGTFRLSAQRKTQLENTLDCVRQVGREVHVVDPRFVNIDLNIEICVSPSAYPGQVKERVIQALTGGEGAFFDPDNFSFGTPLHRAALEAAIQQVPGVRGVEEIFIRARGITDLRELDELVFEVGSDQIIRLQNNPRYPERGSLAVGTMAEVAA